MDASVAGADAAPPEDAAQFCALPIEYDASFSGKAMSVAQDGGGPLPVPPASTCSPLGAPPVTTIVFVNNSACAIKTWWVEPSCEEIFYNLIKPGGTLTQPTYEGHVWRLRAADSNSILLETAGQGVGTLTVTYP